MSEFRTEGERALNAAPESSSAKPARNTKSAVRRTVTLLAATGVLAGIGQPLVAGAAEAQTPAPTTAVQAASNVDGVRSAAFDSLADGLLSNLLGGQGKEEPKKQAPPKPSPEQQAAKDDAAKRERILDAARKEIGTQESGENCSPYSSQCVSWCALFAMEMWNQGGVDVDNEEYAFTGNVFTTGQQKGTAYGADQLSQAKPGDVLLVGSGPSSASSSEHIVIVEEVNGNTVTTIEGNTNGEGSYDGDGVYRKQHELSADKFYGGVSPW